jgi:D-alanine-D-alanine ligase
MKIGLTYDLRSDYLAEGYSELETAEFDREETIESLENSLKTLGHHTDRIGNARRLIERLARNDRWDMVFNIAEGLRGVGREAQVPAILDVYDIPYTFSDPLVMSLTLHKGMTKRVIRDAGIPTSDFFVFDGDLKEDDITFKPPFFIKPVAEGTGKGITPDSIIREKKDLIPACFKMLAANEQPVLIERYLPGREFTVGITGTGSESAAVGTMEVHLLPGSEEGVYSYANKENCEELVKYIVRDSLVEPVVKICEEVAINAWRALGCRDGGRIDLRCDENEKPYFLEVNPLAGLHPDHSDLPIIAKGVGLGYQALIERILASACKRIKIKSLIEQG